MLDLAKIVDSVEIRVSEMKQEGRINFPRNYSPGNALRGALLILNGLDGIEKCTPDSIRLALLEMATKGLNPLKKQVYFIVLGTKLWMPTSYFGDLAMCKRIPGVGDIRFQVIREKDTFKAEIINGQRIISEHVQDWQDESPIIGAYCIILGEDGEIKHTEIINRKQIDKAWAMSKSQGRKVHENFEKDMVLRTVIRKAVKYYVNSSDDAYLDAPIFDDPVEEPAEVIDIEPEVIPDLTEKAAKHEEKPEETDKNDQAPEKEEKISPKKPVTVDLFGEK